MKAPARKIRAAVYCRVSTEERLGMEFNSIQAQQEACEAYIASQRSGGWVLVPDAYVDAGISGGSLQRPALQRLLSDVERGAVQVVVTYKIDRLSRSISDFVKLVELFDEHGATFVSGDAVCRHDNGDGPIDPEHLDELCRIRERPCRRTDP